jgi:hypothetical protein
MNGKSQTDTLGIDLQPEPHFIRCSRQSLEELNKNVDRKNSRNLRDS